jgi:two-component system, OmpR family, alkaline phosphatase synthesis response regulator PhoP
MRNVLILDRHGDEKSPAGALARALRDAGDRAVRLALDGDALPERVLERAFDGQLPDIVLIDLSNASGALPLRRWQQLRAIVWGEDAPEPPLIALLAPIHLGQIDWRSQVDDFILPPYDVGEAQVRLDVLLRRHRSLTYGTPNVLPGVSVDTAQRQVRDAQGRLLPLTPREFELLRFLLTHRGRSFTRERLLDLVWGVEFDGGLRTVDIHVRRLRAKLPAPAAALLETRRGIGYCLRGA